jgi:4-amino-4-deoxy-L-arabinose transferase-like glycosyltransferase
LPVKFTLTEPRKSWLLIAALWGLLLVLAALRPLAVPDEGRYGEIGRWMLQSGDWLTPRLNGIPFFHKPPYLYWLEAGLLSAFGVHELAVRLAPALHAGLMLTALYLAARSIGGEATARRAALMLGTSMAFLMGGQYVNHDMLVASWIGVAIWCFAFAFMAGDKPRALWARLGFAACAMGFLSKGLIGVALPGLVLLVWLLWTRQFKKVLYLPWASGLLIFCAMALPWFVMAQQKYPKLFDYMFLGQQVNRFTATNYNNGQPWWFYFLCMALLLFPWVFFALVPKVSGPTLLQNDKQPVAPQWRSLMWIWVVAITGFFTLPNSKLIGYILPVIPPLALLASWGWERALSPRAWAEKLFAGVCLLNMVLASTFSIQAAKLTSADRSQPIAKALRCAAKPADTVYLSGAFPYDLPFYTQATRPMVVLEEWERLRKQADDSWERELFEGADFDAQAATVLQPLQDIARLGGEPNHWLVVRADGKVLQSGNDWEPFVTSDGWVLYRSGGLTPESPKAAEDKSLSRCKDQRN